MIPIYLRCKNMKIIYIDRIKLKLFKIKKVGQMVDLFLGLRKIIS